MNTHKCPNSKPSNLRYSTVTNEPSCKYEAGDSTLGPSSRGAATGPGVPPPHRARKTLDLANRLGLNPRPHAERPGMHLDGQQLLRHLRAIETDERTSVAFLADWVEHWTNVVGQPRRNNVLDLVANEITRSRTSTAQRNGSREVEALTDLLDAIDRGDLDTQDEPDTSKPDRHDEAVSASGICEDPDRAEPEWRVWPNLVAVIIRKLNPRRAQCQ